MSDYTRSVSPSPIRICPGPDHARTQFVCVCIAEYLSVMETERLLQELEQKHVKSGYVICNQLLPQLTDEEEALLAGEAASSSTSTIDGVSSTGPAAMIHSRATKLMRARAGIQRKYFRMLQGIPAIKTIIPMELQPMEVTGRQALCTICSF